MTTCSKRKTVIAEKHLRYTTLMLLGRPMPPDIPVDTLFNDLQEIWLWATNHGEAIEHDLQTNILGHKYYSNSGEYNHRCQMLRFAMNDEAIAWPLLCKTAIAYGVDSGLDAYLAGVPLADIVA